MPRQPADQSFQLEHAERSHHRPAVIPVAGDVDVDGGRMTVQVAEEGSFQVGECQSAG